MNPQLQAVLTILEKPIHKVPAVKDAVTQTTNAIKDYIDTNAKLALQGVSSLDIARFYAAVGYNAVVKEVDILDATQLKNAIGFAEIPPLLNLLFTSLDANVMPALIKNSAATYNTLYSTRSINAFKNSQDWQKHVLADIASVHRLVIKTKGNKWEENLNNYFKREGANAKFRYQDTVNDVVAMLKSVYSSSYQLTRPAGIIIPFKETNTEESLNSILAIERATDEPQGHYTTLKADGDLYRALAHQAYHYLGGDNIKVYPNADTFNVADIIETPRGTRVFYPKVHARLLQKYNLHAHNPNMLGTQKYSTWQEAEKALYQYIDYTFKTLIAYAFEKHKAAEASFYDLNSDEDMVQAVRNNRLASQQLETLLKGYYEKLYRSILTTFVLTEFKGTNDSPARFVVRFIGEATRRYNGPAYVKAAATESYKVLSKDENITLNEVQNINNKQVYELSAKQIEHTFNTRVADATPNFAASALSYLQNLKTEGPVVSWLNMLVGLDMDGNIIIGQEKVRYINNLVHWLQAGSRAGKGVMSYNLILSALSEKKLAFFSDRKPDTTKELAEHAGFTNGVPNLAMVNGSDTSALDKEKEAHLVAWQQNYARKNKPDWLHLESDVIDDFIYMRQMFIVIALIYTITDVGMEKLNTRLGFAPDEFTGLFTMFDEYSNFMEAFAMRWHPGIDTSINYKVPTSAAMDALRKQKGVMFEKLEKKGFYEDINLDLVYKGMVTIALEDYRRAMEQRNRAGLVDAKKYIDILIIGQGIKSQFAKEGYKPNAGESGVYNKGSGVDDYNAFRLRDMLTNIFTELSAQDYILGWPNGMKAADILDAEGRNKVAAKYLNGSTRGYAYIQKDDLNQKEKAFYFKPFLLLNEGTELPILKEPGATEKDMAEAAAQHKNGPGSYLANLASNIEGLPGISWADVRSQIKEDLQLSDDPSDTTESLAGVRPYAEAIGFKPERYKATVDFMNRLVKELGYPGTWHEFVTDTRPEWFIGPRDIHNALFPSTDYAGFENRKSIDFIRIYAQSPLYKGEALDFNLIGAHGTEDEDYIEEDTHDDFLQERMQELEQQGYEEEPDYLAFDEEEDVDAQVDEQVNSVDTSDVDFTLDPNIFSLIDDTDEEDVTTYNDGVTVYDDNVTTYDDEKDFEEDPTWLDESLVDTVNSDTTNAPGIQTNTLSSEAEGTRNTVKDILSDPQRGIQPDTKVSEAVETARDLGKQDILNKSLAYGNIELYALSTKHPGVDLVSWYEDGYKEAYKTQPKSKTLEMKIQSGLEHAAETRTLLGVQYIGVSNIPDSTEAQQVINDFAEEHGTHPQGFALIKQQAGVFKENLTAFMRADREADVLKATSNAYTLDGLKTYGTNDIYMINGKATKVNNLDYVLSDVYHEIAGPTGVDTDKSLIEYMRSISANIINKVAGVDQIKTLTVQAGGKLIINDVMLVNFAIPKAEYAKLPLMIKNTVDQGLWGQVFVWGYAQSCKNLRAVTISSDDFVQDYMRPTLGTSAAYLTPYDLLELLPSVQQLTIGIETYTREDYETYKEEQKVHSFFGLKGRRKRKAQLKEQQVLNEEVTDMYYQQAVKQDKTQTQSQGNSKWYNQDPTHVQGNTHVQGKDNDQGDQDYYEDTTTSATRQNETGSRAGRRAKAVGKRAASSAYNTTGDLTHKGYDNSKALVRYGFKRKGFGKLLGVAGLGLTVVTGTGLVLYKAIDWGKETYTETKGIQ